MAAREEGLPGSRDRPIKQFHRQLRRIVGRTSLRNRELLEAMLAVCAALAGAPPSGERANLRLRSGRRAEASPSPGRGQRVSGGRSR
jgi:hypothetical protein